MEIMNWFIGSFDCTLRFQKWKTSSKPQFIAVKIIASSTSNRCKVSLWVLFRQREQHFRDPLRLQEWTLRVHSIKLQWMSKGYACYVLVRVFFDASDSSRSCIQFFNREFSGRIPSVYIERWISFGSCIWQRTKLCGSWKCNCPGFPQSHSTEDMEIHPPRRASHGRPVGSRREKLQKAF